MHAVDKPRARPWSTVRWVLLMGAVIMIVPSSFLIVFLVWMGQKLSIEGSKAREYCAAYPLGARVETEAMRSRGEAAGMTVWVRSIDGGAQLQALTGVMTTTFTCEIEVEGDRVTSNRVVVDH